MFGSQVMGYEDYYTNHLYLLFVSTEKSLVFTFFNRWCYFARLNYSSHVLFDVDKQILPTRNCYQTIFGPLQEQLETLR